MSIKNKESRPSMEQVMAVVSFMEEHPALGLGQLRGLEGRETAKKLWFKLTRIVNNITGPTRPMKSWIKYWADKKSQVRNKVISSGGDPNTLSSNIEKKIWDLFLTNDSGRSRAPLKLETYFDTDDLFTDNSIDQNNTQSETALTFEEPVMDIEERQTAVMEKLVKVMSDQASALSQLAQATLMNSQAMERLADAAHIQARAADRLAGTFETIGAATHDIRNAILDIDATMKRFYATPAT